MLPQRRDIWSESISVPRLRQRPRLARWREAVDAVLADGGPEVLFQPVVDLRSGAVRGYQAVSRFQEWGQARPEEWFARAAQVGLGPRLEAAAASKALHLARTRTPGQFLALDIAPDSLLADEVQTVLEQQQSLKDIILQLTQRHPSSNPKQLKAVLSNARRSGARLAVDDAGSEYAALHWILASEPDIVKVDRSIIAGLDHDPAKVALAEMLAAFAARINAAVLADGVTRFEELDALVSIGVPLAQGFLLGAPGEPWPDCPSDAVDRIRERTRLSSPSAVGGLVEVMPAVAASTFPAINFGPNRLLLDDDGRPIGYCLDGDPPLIAPGGLLRVNAGEPSATVLAKAMTRDAATRWHAVACLDDVGRVVGLVRIDLLARAVARLAGSEPDTTGRGAARLASVGSTP